LTFNGLHGVISHRSENLRSYTGTRKVDKGTRGRKKIIWNIPEDATRRRQRQEDVIQEGQGRDGLMFEEETD
jgi:hypothetical protein